VADDESDNWTLLVLGGPGQPSRRYRVNLRAIGLLVIALMLGALGLGFVLGKGADAHTAVASITSSDSSAPAAVIEPVPAVAPAIAAEPPPPVVPAPVAAVSTGGAAAASPPSEAAAASAARSAEVAAAAEGKPLLLLRSASSDEVVEVHPFAADGSPNASAFQLLETVMACGDGHHQAPAPALVRVLLEAQHAFDKPLVLLGGRCARHGDHPEAIDHHRAGRAADVRVRGVSTEQLMNWLVKRGAGGAGRYKGGGYVHVDVRSGPLEQWRGEEPEAPKPAAEAPKPAANLAEAASAAEPAEAPAPPPAEN
jgi:hypothetical protein